MDILQPVPIDKWSLLRDSLKRDWPTYAYYYYMVNNLIKWKTKEPEFKLEVFCPNGDVNAGTFIAVSKQSWNLLYAFAFNESKDLLRRVLKETKVIDWNDVVIFSGVHQSFGDVIEEFVEKEGENKSITMVDKTTAHNYFKPKEECARMEVTIPEECELKNLDQSNVPLVNSLWPHRDQNNPEKSIEFISSVIRLNRGVGLFLKEDNSLVSWVLHFDWGGLGLLQTVEEHKRKGYGKIVVKAMIKKLAEEENLDSTLFVVLKNVASEKLFESLGYQRLKTATWYIITPKSSAH